MKTLGLTVIMCSLCGILNVSALANPSGDPSAAPLHDDCVVTAIVKPNAKCVVVPGNLLTQSLSLGIFLGKANEVRSGNSSQFIVETNTAIDLEFTGIDLRHNGENDGDRIATIYEVWNVDLQPTGMKSFSEGSPCELTGADRDPATFGFQPMSAGWIYNIHAKGTLGTISAQSAGAYRGLVTLTIVAAQ